MRYGSVCAGIEAASVAWDWTPVWFSEIEKFPSKVLKERFPDVPNLGDMTKLHENEIFRSEPIDLLVGGTPCFKGGTLVLCQRGLIPISEVIVGDLVLTHKNRWQPVIRVGSKIAKTIVVKGQGNSDGVVTTSNHRFYAKEVKQVWHNEVRNYRKVVSKAQWVEGGNMKGKFWAIPSVFPQSNMPEIKYTGREKELNIKYDCAFMCLLGRWLADGWCRFYKQRRGYVLICCNKKEKEIVADEIRKTGLHFSVSEEKTTTRFQISSKPLAKWIRNNFGSGCRGKVIPAWILGLDKDLRKAFFDGYISGDGCVTVNGFRLTTVNQKLAIGICFLATSLGYAVSRRYVSLERDCIIEGRSVNETGFYQVTFYNSPRSSFNEENHQWGLVKSVEETNLEEIVYDLEVKTDHSYNADGITVHNCQSFSIAGLRRGLEDERGNLALEFVRLLAIKRPQWFVWENVPGVLSSGGGRDFGSILGGFTGRKLTQTKWGRCGIIEGIPDAYSVAWRVLDAQYFGVPQRRRRVFVVGCLGDWRSAAEVLFESKSVSGDIEESREKRESVAGGIKEGVRVYRESGQGYWLKDDKAGVVRAKEGRNISHIVNAEGSTGLPLKTAANIGKCVNNQTPLVIAQNQVGEVRVGEVVNTLNTNSNASGRNTPIIFTQNQRDEVRLMDKPGALQAEAGMKQQFYLFSSKYTIRRLTPLECEKLQGFPDGWTDIGADGPRYKAIGNSMAVPVMRWIGNRIKSKINRYV